MSSHARPQAKPVAATQPTFAKPRPPRARRVLWRDEARALRAEPREALRRLNELGYARAEARLEAKPDVSTPEDELASGHAAGGVWGLVDRAASHGVAEDAVVEPGGENAAPREPVAARDEEPALDGSGASAFEAQAPGGGKANGALPSISVDGTFVEQKDLRDAGVHPKGFSAETVSHVKVQGGGPFSFEKQAGKTKVQLAFRFSLKRLTTTFFGGARPTDKDAVEADKTLGQHEEQHRRIARSFWSKANLERLTAQAGVPASLSVDADPRTKEGKAKIKAVVDAEAQALKSYLDQVHAVEQFAPDEVYVKAGKPGYAAPPAPSYSPPPNRSQ